MSNNPAWDRVDELYRDGEPEDSVTMYRAIEFALFMDQFIGEWDFVPAEAEK